VQRPRVTTLDSIEWETERHATITFDDSMIAASPAGSFCMVWVPGVDEVPMGTGFTTADGKVSLTVEAKGDCTKAMLALDAGAKIGVRGPYGQGFRLPATGHVCFVGGGTGIAPMARGAQQALAAGLEVTIIAGARSEDLLLLHPHLSAQAAAGNLHYYPCTNDGSHGFAGFTTQQLDALWASGAKFDYVAACGPELMMVAVVAQCDTADVPVEASLERYMKCAVGICDACTVGDGQRVCVEGPVFTSAALKEIPEFGVGHRDSAGIMHPW
jgi:dihydroorotate dehydrogenase electron transfer subunit